MRNYIFLLILVVFTSCKTTKEDYSRYPFIDEGIKSEKYEVNTVLPEEVELLTIFGHPYSVDPKSFHAEEINKMPLIVYDKSNILYFRYKNYKINDFKYNITNNLIDTLSLEDMDVIRNSHTKKENKFIDFRFPEAENYCKILKIELKDTIPDNYIKKIYAKYPNNEKKRNEVGKLMSIYYKTDFINLHMPKENVKFKYNLLGNGKVVFFGNEELYKKGYIYIYIYIYIHNISNIIPHSRGLYVIRPKEKK